METRTCTKRTRLTDQNVRRILAKCIQPVQTTQPALPSSAIIEVEGIYDNFTFCKEVLDSERQHIEDMLKSLPKGFKQGWSFGEMYHTKTGRQWTANIKTMEALMVLGVAIGKLKYPVPKSLWWSLPGGMPYVILN